MHALANMLIERIDPSACGMSYALVAQVPRVAGRAVLNIFYEEQEGDRWLSFDRYPRRVIRRIVRAGPGQAVRCASS